MKLFYYLIPWLFITSMCLSQEPFPPKDFCSDQPCRIDFIFMDWRYNPPGSISEYNLRTNNEIEKFYVSISDSSSIQKIYANYCDETKNRRIESEHFSVRLIMDLHFVDGTIKSILMDYYFEFDDKSEHNFRNYELLLSIVEIVPSTHAFERHKISPK